MSTAAGSAFKVALVQMRSAMEPKANLGAALAAIEEAKRAGADYVLTPEMTNIMAPSASACSPTIVDEEHDPTLAALREAARKHRSISISARSRSRRRRTRRRTVRS